MRKRDLKKAVFDAYKVDTPDLYCSIVAACQAERNNQSPCDAMNAQHVEYKPSFIDLFKRTAVVAMCFMIFAFGAFIGAITSRNGEMGLSANAEACVYLDVNPNVELWIDSENKVVECLAGNSDAETVLSGLKLKGVDMHTALSAIVGSMYVNGYLTVDSNSILVSVDAGDIEKTTTLLNDIMAKINSFFEMSDMECSIIAQSVNVDDVLKQRAQENGISVGKMHLLDKMVDGFGSISDNAIKKLSELSIKDLNLIYLQKTNDDPEPDEAIVSGSVNVAISADEATNAVIAEMGKTRDDVECYRTFFLPSRSGESKVIYAVVLMLHNDPCVYKYEVDCQTGEVVQMNVDGLNIRSHS